MGRPLAVPVSAALLAGCAGVDVLWLRSHASQERAICLTFDDGPNGVATEEVLGVLRQYEVQATFFLIGKNVEREPALARRIVDEGHLVGNHSYGHETLLAFQSTEQITRNLASANELILKATGVRPHYFRPPNGLMTKRLRRVCTELDLVPVGVHIFIYDSFRNHAASIAKQVLKRVRGGFYVIVLHDGFGTNVTPRRAVIAEALELLIPALRRDGYRWVSPDYLCDRQLDAQGIGIPADRWEG